MKIGVISDTHGYLDPALYSIFDGVNQIIHAGDIGGLNIINSLEKIAPVIAVNGNNDYDLSFPKFRIEIIESFKFFITHKLNSKKYDIEGKIFIENPDIVIFGHTHTAVKYYKGSKLYINPGYAGYPDGHWKRSVAILEWDKDRFSVEFIPL
ncbi:MAG: metallophosphoesterase family protein [Verrucomicrobiia bacterium]